MNWKTYWSVVSSRREESRFAGSRRTLDEGLAGSMLLAAFEAPVDVTSREAEAEVEELEAMIAKGRVAPTDLVYQGDGCWVEAREHPLLSEACDYAEDRQRVARRWRMAGGAGVVLFMAGALLAWAHFSS